MAIKTIDDLFVRTLRETYYLETELVRPLDEMAKRTANDTISRALATHSDETKDHVERLRGSFSALGVPPTETSNPAFDGLMEQRRRTEAEIEGDELRDVFFLGVATKIERLEISNYEGLSFLANKLEYGDDVTRPFRKNVREERKTLAELEALGAASELKTLWRNLLR